MSRDVEFVRDDPHGINAGFVRDDPHFNRQRCVWECVATPETKTIQVLLRFKADKFDTFSLDHNSYKMVQVLLRFKTDNILSRLTWIMTPDVVAAISGLLVSEVILYIVHDG